MKDMFSFLLIAFRKRDNILLRSVFLAPLSFPSIFLHILKVSCILLPMFVYYLDEVSTLLHYSNPLSFHEYKIMWSPATKERLNPRVIDLKYVFKGNHNKTKRCKGWGWLYFEQLNSEFCKIYGITISVSFRDERQSWCLAVSLWSANGCKGLEIYCRSPGYGAQSQC